MAAVPSTDVAAEAEALERLYDRHARRIFGFCLHQLRKRDEAEDAVQLTFMYALGALRRGVVPTAESAWLLKIARNVCLSRFDAARRRSNVEQPRDPLVLAESAPAVMPEDAPDLRDALARLPERQRRAIVMREWQGLSYAEIGAELGIGTAAVETLIFRARRSLARELRGDEKRRTFDLTTLLGGAKSLLGGGAAKVAIGAVTVASVGAAASVPLARHQPAPPPQAVRVAAPRPARAVVVSAPARPQRHRAAAARHRIHVVAPAVAEPPPPRVAATEIVVPEAPAPAPQPVQHTETQAPAAQPAATPATTSEAPAPAPPAGVATPPAVDAATPALPPVPAPAVPSVQVPTLPPLTTPTVPDLPPAPSLPTLP